MMDDRNAGYVHVSEGPSNLIDDEEVRSSENIGLPVHSLYVGSRDGDVFTDVDRRAVTEAVSASFDCFTFVDANGYFKGRGVATLIIKIGTDDAGSIKALANELGRLLDQEAIGLETAGTYRSISMG